MFLSYVTLAVALSLSAIAAWYSIAGLAAIFAAAVIPIIVMGGILELAKVIVTLWLHEYWSRCRFLMKAYLVPAVATLMLITSMGIFGFLSKAHSDQSMISGDVQAKIAIYDEKIRTERENIDANRRALKQLDEAVDQVMGRSVDERGAERAVQIRRSQQAERNRLLREIGISQKNITVLNEERAPIAAEVRKVEAEVGPIKYIAALVYGNNTDANLLEAAVRWVIILLVIVFDPLAIMMLLAATESLKWAKQDRQQQPAYPPDDGPLTEQQMQQIKESAEPVLSSALVNQQTHPYLFAGNFWKKPLGWVSQGPMVVPKESTVESNDSDIDEENNIDLRQAMKAWKLDHPNGSLKEQRKKLARGEIEELPWMSYLPAQQTFGSEFAVPQRRGDIHVLTRSIPHSLHKWNGTNWIAIDKDTNDSYTNNKAYVNYLIEKLESGEYDPDYLTDSEREQVAKQLSTGKA